MKTGRVAAFVVLLALTPACVSKARSWKNFEVADDGSTTVLSQSFGLIGALATDPKADPVTVRMQSKPEDVKEAFEQRTGRHMTWHTALASQRLAP